MDRRILKTRQAILSAFQSLLLEKGFEAITVTEITKQANISRKTFYLHYIDKYDLLEHIIDNQFSELKALSISTKDLTIAECTLILFRYFNENKTLLTALFSCDTPISFRQKLLRFTQEHQQNVIRNYSSAQEEEIIVCFLSAGLLGAMEAFVLGHLDWSTDEVGLKIGKLMESSLIPHPGLNKSQKAPPTII